MITGINNIGIAVSNVEKSVQFYTKLGFQLTSHEPGASAALQAGTATLYAFQTTNGHVQPSRTLNLAANPPGIDHISLDVDSVDHIYEQLKDKLSFESKPADQPWGYRAASLLDPDGNRIYLLTPLSGENPS